MRTCLLVLALLLVGCAGLPAHQRAQKVVLKAQEQGFEKVDVDTGLFTIRTFSKINMQD